MAVRCAVFDILSKYGRLVPTASNSRQLLPALECATSYATAATTTTTGSSDPLTSKIITEHQRLEELFQQYEKSDNTDPSTSSCE
jgi:hypothetical protein